MNTSAKVISLLTKSEPGGSLLTDLPHRLKTELAHIQQLESQAAGRAVRVGLWLWQAKAQLAHGAFQPWIDRHVAGRGYRMCAYYMKLALAFAEKARVSEAALHAICAHDFAVRPRGPALAPLERLATFIGGLSLNELLIKHGIKSVGLKSELAARSGDIAGEGDGEASAATASGEARATSATAASAAAAPATASASDLHQLWHQAYAPAKSLADLLTEHAAALTPAQRAALEAELKRALQALRAA